MHRFPRTRQCMTGGVLLMCLMLAGHAHAQVCGDADGNGAVTVTDGVQTLRSAAGLSTSCTLGRCDVDGNGAVTVTDGVNVLRVAAGLLVTTFACAPQARFVDNGDGTITDNQTGLQWEKKTGTVRFRENDCSATECSDPHDVNNTYQWCRGPQQDAEGFPGDCDSTDNPPNGGAFMDFLVRLNTPSCFAGHCDWRLPSESELESLEFGLEQTLYPCPGGVIDLCPKIDAIFNPTRPDDYWTTTTTTSSPAPDDGSQAVTYNFSSGRLRGFDKIFTAWVRAVRTLP
jgi:hypothetical protein